MNVFSATDSGLALRIRHMLNGKMRSMGAGLRVIAAVLLCGLAGAMLPTAGVAQTRDRDADTDRGERKTAAHFEELNRKIRAAIDAGKLTPEEGRAKLREARIWHAAMATDPSEWSEELKAMILERKPDSTIEEIAEGIRQRQARMREKEGETVDFDALNRKIQTAVDAGELTPEEGRRKLEAMRRAMATGGRGDRGDKADTDRIRAYREGIVARAMAEAPEQWSDELKAHIERAGWDLEKFTEGIRQRQAAGTRVTDFSQLLIELSTVAEQTSWGEIKKDVGAAE
jgi:polyhydroxyalkanoate synthesis regulator phasin